MNRFPLLPFSLFLLLDFLGVFAGAIGGGLEAMRNEKYDYDFIGVLGLAMTSALGGGIMRDILLQKGPPLAFQDVRYLPTALAGALIALAFRGHIGPRVRRAILWIDAAAIGFFAVAGSTRAIDAHMAILPAVILGAMTAVGGGAIRDVLSGRTPRVFESPALRNCGGACFGSVSTRCKPGIHTAHIDVHGIGNGLPGPIPGSSIQPENIIGAGTRAFRLLAASHSVQRSKASFYNSPIAFP